MALIQSKNILEIEAASIPSQVAARLRAFLNELKSRSSIRNELADLSDAKLRDIGLTPNDVKMRNVPLSTNVAQDLALRAGSRAGNW